MKNGGLETKYSMHVHCAHLHRYTTICSYMGQHHISKSSHLVACGVGWIKVLLYTIFAVLYAKVVASPTSEVVYLISDIYGCRLQGLDIASLISHAVRSLVLCAAVIR